MKIERTKTVIKVTQKELDALKIVKDFLDDLAIEEDISESFERYRYGYSSLDEMVSSLNDVMNFLDSEKQEEYIINVINKEEN